MRSAKKGKKGRSGRTVGSWSGRVRRRGPGSLSAGAVSSVAPGLQRPAKVVSRAAGGSGRNRTEASNQAIKQEPSKQAWTGDYCSLAFCLSWLTVQYILRTYIQYIQVEPRVLSETPPVLSVQGMPPFLPLPSSCPIIITADYYGR